MSDRIDDVRDDLRQLNQRLTDVSVEVGKQGVEIQALGKQVTEIHAHLLGESSKQAKWNRRVIWLVIVGLLSAAGVGAGVKALSNPAQAKTIVATDK